MAWMCSPIPYAEILASNVMAWGGRVFGRWIGHKSRTFRHSDPYKRGSRDIPGPVFTWQYDVRNPAESPCPTVPELWSPSLSLHNCEKSISVLPKLPSQCYFLLAAWTDWSSRYLLNKVLRISYQPARLLWAKLKNMYDFYHHYLHSVSAFSC